ncbi:bZIP transcription factor [Nocardia sp. CA-107356]|uniref:bZIP transcription factor n=1 Tax=Nocardia sp. CA-107356 TaxID=3239972 RepID=UPI003D8DD880
MWMPDRDQMQADQKYAQYVPLLSTIGWYGQLPKTFQGYFDSCGNGDENKGSPPEIPKLPEVKGSDLANFTNYGSTATSLRQAADLMYDSAKAIAPQAKKTEAISIAAQKAVNAGIDHITNSAPTVPKPGMKEDQHIYEFCNEAIQSVANAFDEAANATKDVKDGLDKETAKLKELEDQIKKLQQENADLKKKLLDPATVPQVPATPTTPGIDPNNVTPIDDNSLVPGLNDLNPTTPGVDTGTTPTGTSLDDKVQQALDNLNNSATNPNNATPASVPSTAAASPANSGMDMMSSMLPMLMSQMMNRGQNDTDLNNRRSEYDPYQDELRAVPAAVAPAQPAVQPATSTPAPATNTAPPTNSSSTQPTAGMPGRTPNSDGTVLYTFPDGRTQKVSVTVAQALDAAFGNASGTDAQAAYAKTPAKWSDKKQIGTPVDPYQLMTGDVAIWDGRTAIVVAFPSDEGGTLEVVVSGQLKQFTPTEMSDSAGEFGQFVGFNHPHGIEATAPEDHDQGKMSGMPVTGDPSAGAAMPAVAAPA